MNYRQSLISMRRLHKGSKILVFVCGWSGISRLGPILSLIVLEEEEPSGTVLTGCFQVFPRVLPWIRDPTALADYEL